MLIVLLVIIGLSLLILGHEAGHFFAAKFFGLKVEEFGFGFPPRIFAKKHGETTYSLNLLPFGGFVKIAGENERLLGNTGEIESLPASEKNRFFLFQPAWKRSLVIAAGVIINFLIGWFLLSLILTMGTEKALIISSVQPNSPAEEVGLMSGDVLKGYTEAGSFIEFIDTHRGEQTKLDIKRGGEDFSFIVSPKTGTIKDEGALGVFLVEIGEDRHGFFSAMWNGLKRATEISILIVATFYRLIRNLLFSGSLLAGVVGPLGIFSVAQEAGNIGLIYLVQLISLISLNLAVVNLIPLPALDGGRILLILIEKVKGSPISRKTEAVVNGLGFMFLIFLMIVLTVRDASNLL